LKYGNAFVNANNTTMLLPNLMLWPLVDCDLFIRFYSQMKKYHTLSVVSTVRLHRIQAKMDLRYFLESTANAAFSLAHTSTRNYFDLENSRIGDAQKATTKAYKWLEATRPRSTSKRLTRIGQ
jgi:lipase chaperone LimK